MDHQNAQNIPLAQRPWSNLILSPLTDPKKLGSIHPYSLHSKIVSLPCFDLPSTHLYFNCIHYTHHWNTFYSKKKDSRWAGIWRDASISPIEHPWIFNLYMMCFGIFSFGFTLNALMFEINLEFWLLIIALSNLSLTLTPTIELKIYLPF